MSIIDFYLIKNQLQNLECSEHNRHPEIISTTLTSLEVKTCCEAFRGTVTNKYRDMIIEQGKHIAINKIKEASGKFLK